LRSNWAIWLFRTRRINVVLSSSWRRNRKTVPGTTRRALAFQPYFDSGFPHGYNQWVSAAATSWATMALTLALPEREQVASIRLR
jgi:hypothetical protein